jgi:hypothetical protein
VAVFFWDPKLRDQEKGSVLNRIGRILLLCVFAAAIIARAETPSIDSPSGNGARDTSAASYSKAHKWEYGPFVNWGTGVGDRSDYKFFWAGAQLGKTMFPPVHAGVFSGQFELGGNIMPLWQAYTPAPHVQTFYYPGPGCPTGGCSFVGPEGGGTFRGVSLTPVVFRWNFLNHSQRFKNRGSRGLAGLFTPPTSFRLLNLFRRGPRGVPPFGTSLRKVG